jgi:hypothetical protein
VPGVTITVQAVLAEGLREVARHEIPESNWQDNRPMRAAYSAERRRWVAGPCCAGVM